VGTFLTGLYAFRMIFVVFGGEPSPFAREHFHPPGRDVAAISMGSAVAVLAVLSVVGGWIQIAGVWHPLASFLEVSARPLIEPSGAQDLLASVLAVSAGLAGIGLAWWFYGARRAPVPRLRPAQTLLERKLYFDEAYDLAFYRPADLVARAEARLVEEPLVWGTADELAETARDLGRIATRVQTGLLRTYALAIAASVAVLAVVFVALR
jgi:NADH-quinone oxidoreductase subunit L